MKIETIEETGMTRKDKGHEAAIEADRRGFLKLAGLGAVAGSATLAGGAAQAAETPSETAAGYRETEHVKAFYASARF